jgi:hypothetical protein
MSQTGKNKVFKIFDFKKKLTYVFRGYGLKKIYIISSRKNPVDLKSLFKKF